MNKTQTIIYSLDTLDTAVDALCSLLKQYKVFTFTGTLGAGKTTLIKSILVRCGVKDIITSPTFTYMGSYVNDQGNTFYHFDLYRIPTLRDFVQAGFDEFLYAPNSWVFIEWPQIAMPLLTKNVCHVTLDYYGEDQRILSYTISEDIKVYN